MAKTQKHNPFLPLIGVGKVAKSAVLFGASYALAYLRRQDDIGKVLKDWADAIHVDPDGTMLHKLIERTVALPTNRLHFTAIALFVYGSLFAVEGVGLILRRRWAEYVTVVVTSLLLPLEVYELFHAGHRFTKVVVLVLNVAVLVYLVWNLYVTRDDGQSTHLTPPVTANGSAREPEQVA